MNLNLNTLYTKNCPLLILVCPYRNRHHRLTAPTGDISIREEKPPSGDKPTLQNKGLNEPCCPIQAHLSRQTVHTTLYSR